MPLQQTFVAAVDQTANSGRPGVSSTPRLALLVIPMAKKSLVPFSARDAKHEGSSLLVG